MEKWSLEKGDRRKGMGERRQEKGDGRKKTGERRREKRDKIREKGDGRKEKEDGRQLIIFEKFSPYNLVAKINNF